MDIGQCCNELIREDTLKKFDGQQLTERKALLFDGLLILCKLSGKEGNVLVAANNATIDKNRYLSEELQLKEIFFITKVDIIDKEDTEELQNAFKIAPKDHPNVILVAKSVEDKNNWMADLVMCNIQSILEGSLNNILLEDEERKCSLRLPPAHLYKFVEQDSKDNIVLETRNKDSVPLIKGATLIKLIERLTYHTYVDPVFVRTFFTTYRSFCSPDDLLTLLIERFDIPDFSLVYNEEEKLSVCKTTAIEDRKRYRREFRQPVQFRVLNALRHWVNYHFYDFERDEILLERLQLFLNGTRFMRKWVESLIKIVQRKCEPLEQQSNTFSFVQSLPSIETHLKIPENNEECGILTIHPIEFARQLTLLEYELYRIIKPSEFVKCEWTKKDKEKMSPNLTKMIKRSINFKRWLQKIIVETQNFEERVAIVSRAIEIMMVLVDLNNFNGAATMCSAIESIIRLDITYRTLDNKLRTALREMQELYYYNFKKYQEKTIIPPCVPFLDVYLNNIQHIEEKNSDYLEESLKLINFNKLQKVAEIIDKIRQYQNQPYCLSVESKIRQYIENICSFDSNMSDDDINNYVYTRSLEIEPRGIKEPIEFPRKWPEINLKSPSINKYIERNLLQRSVHRMITLSKYALPEAQSDRFSSGPSKIVSPESSNPSENLRGIATLSCSDNIPFSQLLMQLKSSKRESLYDQSWQQTKSSSCADADAVGSIQSPVSIDVDSSDFKELLSKISSTTDIMKCLLHDVEVEYNKLKFLVHLSDPEKTLDQFKRIVDQLTTVVNDSCGDHNSLQRDLLTLIESALH